jgi:hypothetical protein
MKLSKSFVAAFFILTFIFFACQDDNKPTIPTDTNNQTGDQNLAYLKLQCSESDSIDSTGTYYKFGDSIYWVMEIDSSKFDTLPLLVAVNNDTASLNGITYSDFPMPVDIKGLKVKGTTTTFEGSVWKAKSISTLSTSGIITIETPSGADLYLYFCTTNNKVYSLERGDALNILAATLILECPYALFAPQLETSMGLTIDNVRSNCDTTFATQTTQAGVINLFAVSNFDSLSIDIYTSVYGVAVPITKVRLVQ